MSAPPIPTSDCAPRGQRITLAAAEQRTGLNRKTLYRRIKEGKLRAYHVVGTREVGDFIGFELGAMFVPYGGVTE